MTLICQLYWLAPLNHAPCFLSVSGPRLSYGYSLSVNCVTVLPWITHRIVEAAFFIRETSLGGTFSSLHQGSNRWSKTLHPWMIENSFAVSRRGSCWSSSAHQSCIFCSMIKCVYVFRSSNHYIDVLGCPHLYTSFHKSDWQRFCHSSSLGLPSIIPAARICLEVIMTTEEKHATATNPEPLTTKLS